MNNKIYRSRKAQVKRITSQISQSVRTGEAQMRASAKIRKFQSRKKIPVIGGYLARRALK